MKRFVYVTSILLSVLMLVMGVVMISVGLIGFIHGELKDPANALVIKTPGDPL